MTARIQVLDLSKRYGEHHVLALDHVALEIGTGEFVALMGPSGCGKSTLLNILGTIDFPSAGHILLEGADVFALEEEDRTRLRRERLGFVFQFFNLLNTLNVTENVALPLELIGRGSPAQQAQTARHMLKNVGMSHRADFFPAQLSGGEMQRVAIARALVHAPDIVLADEPTGNLDTENGEAVLRLLKDLCRTHGQTVIMATHSPEAAGYADRILRMRDGKMLAEGAPA